AVRGPLSSGPSEAWAVLKAIRAPRTPRWRNLTLAGKARRGRQRLRITMLVTIATTMKNAEATRVCIQGSGMVETFRIETIYARQRLLGRGTFHPWSAWRKA